jgi:hypothetical protein
MSAIRKPGTCQHRTGCGQLRSLKPSLYKNDSSLFLRPPTPKALPGAATGPVSGGLTLTATLEFSSEGLRSDSARARPNRSNCVEAMRRGAINGSTFYRASSFSANIVRLTDGSDEDTVTFSDKGGLKSLFTTWPSSGKSACMDTTSRGGLKPASDRTRAGLEVVRKQDSPRFAAEPQTAH